MRKKTVLYLVLLFFTCSVQAIDDAFRFRVFLADKMEDLLRTPFVELSQKSLYRRESQGIALDSTDNPLSKSYVNAIQAKGYPIVCKSRWFNTVVISAADSSCIDTLKTLPFVKEIRLVWVNPKSGKADPIKVSKKKDKYLVDSSNFYGKAAIQVEMLGLKPLHDKGYKGAGKTIAVVDAGFNGVDTMSWFTNLNLLVSKDFIYPPSSVFTGHAHGTAVLSLMASNEAYSLVGSAPEATYCLLRSEDVLSEFPIEEDYWVEAVEFADSIGVDIVTSSLGYTVFDVPELSYGKSKLDGKTSFISRGASIAAQKGMLIVTSAGNDGNGDWKKIDFPADADGVLTVGSVQSDQEKSNFTSIGPTADGRIKPDVMAMGTSNTIITGNGTLSTGSGTSFSAPLVAGMAASVWSAFPQMKATELFRLIKESSNRAAMPDTIYGYGIPNAQKIYISLKESFPQSDFSIFHCYPNPIRDFIHFANFSMMSVPVKINMYNAFGEKVLERTLTGTDTTVDVSSFPDSIYFVEFLVSGERKVFQKMIKRR